MKEKKPWPTRAWRWLRSVKDGKAGEYDGRFRDRYREYREYGLSLPDSFYAALHQSVHERLLRSARREKIDHLPLCHPLGWEQKEEDVVYSGFWLTAAKALDRLPHILSAPFAYVKKAFCLRGKREKDDSRPIPKEKGRIRRRLAYWGPICLAMGVFTYAYLVAKAPIALGAAVNGKPLGLIESMDQFNLAVEKVEDKASAVLGRSFKFPYPVSYYFESESGFLSSEELDAALVGTLDPYIAPGYGLFLDGKLVAAVREEEEIHNTLKQILAEEQARSPEYTVELFSQITVEQETFPTAKMTDQTHLKELLQYGSSNFTTLAMLDDVHSPIHRVCGELGLHFAHSIGYEAYERARKQAEEVDFSNTYYYYENGREVPLTDLLPITLSYSKQIATVDPLPFPEQVVEDPNAYRGYNELAVVGKDGRGVITTKYTYVNGALHSQEVVKTEAFLPPVTQVRHVGAKALPEEIAPGEKNIYILPRQDRINSYFGYRDLDGDGLHNEKHSGVDIEAPMRSKIYAARSGVVEFAESFDTWGKLIRIRHEDGYETLYAHLDEFLVEVGDYVTQGQLIALSGNTGYTTGPHFHFEMKNPKGSSVDPLPFIYKEK